MLAKLEPVAPVDKVDEITKDALSASLQLGIESYEAGLYHRDLNVIASPAQGIRDIFDLSPTATENDWSNLAKRMKAVEGALDGYMASLREGIAAKDAPARRQVEQIITQVAQITDGNGFFIKFADGAKAENGELSAALKAEVEAAGRGDKARPRRTRCPVAGLRSEHPW